MADAYGAIIVCVSGDADLNGLTVTLNRFKWCSDGAEFELKDGNLTFPYGVQYPTAYGRVLFPVDSDGNPISDVSSLDEDDDDLEFDDRQASLKELSENISPSLKDGSIEIT